MKVLDYDGLDYYNSLIENKYAPLTTLNNYLPLSGGTMTGSITLDGFATFAKQTADDSGVTICGGTDTTSPYITLYGKDHDTSPSTISIRTGSNSPAMQLSSDGSLTWNNNDVITSAGGTMTGNIVLGSGAMVSNYNNTTAMRFVGGDATNGYTGKPRIAFFGNNYSTSSLKGVFALVADDSTNSCILNGYPNGSLTWGSKQILTEEGGTISGGFTRSGGSKLASRDVNDSFLYIGGSTSDANGAYLTLYGKDHSSAGRFNLAAKDGTNSTLLVGQANGTLAWGGKDVERVNASGSDYIRFESGLQICWGSAQTTTSGHTYTFPVSFNTSPKVAFSVGNTTESNTSYSTKVTNVSKTSFKGICSNANNTVVGITCTYIAIGFWK